MIKEITSVDNNIVKEIAKLKTKKYREINNRFIIEGYHLVEMAKELLECVFITNKEDYEKFGSITYYLVNDAIINKISSTVNPQGIVGVCKIKKANNDYSNKVLMLDNVSDPGNIGTIIRSSIAFGFNDIILSNNSCDIYNDKVLRSSQGGIFNCNIKYSNLSNEIIDLKNKGYKVYGTALRNSISIDDVKFSDKCVIIMGNEANGISEEVLSLCDECILIPINSIESLNVGVACGIVLNEVRRYQK